MRELHTTQLNLMKFLKHSAPERRVVRGRASDAIRLSRRRENPGFASSVLSAASAVKIGKSVGQSTTVNTTNEDVYLPNLCCLGSKVACSSWATVSNCEAILN